jgi:4-amino-4-deoxy-L-arabinose transferase-like glycosyltransferase
MSQAHPTPPLAPHPLDVRARREALVILGLTALAAVPRFWGFGREGLTHFDEGVYALSGLWSLSPRGIADIGQELIPYAPPGLPLLIGVAYTLAGVSDASALLVTAACGVLTVPVAAWVGRRTLGPGAGAATAALTALSLAHIAFSRKALTEAPFLLCWLAAVGLGGRFLERPGLLRAVAFGLAVGLAQNVKYNGWVAGLVVIVAAVAGLLSDPGARRPASLLRTFGFGALAAAVAAAVYVPWFVFVEAHGGYAALVKHHRSYMGDASQWLPHLRHQLAQVVALSGGMAGGALAWSAAWLAAGVATGGAGWFFPRSHWDAARLRLGLLLGAVILATVPDVAWWVGLGWSLWLLADRRPSWRVLGAWWVVLSAMTPFYHPYARLWLPLHAAGWVMLAGVMVSLGPFPGSVLEDPDRFRIFSRRVLARGAVALVCLALARSHWAEAAPCAFAAGDVFIPTDSLRTAAAYIATASPIRYDPRPSLLVLARRPMAFYLALHGNVPFRLVAGEDDVRGAPRGEHDWAFVDTSQVGDASVDLAPTRRIERRWRRVKSWTETLDPVTRLDVIPGSVYEVYEPDPVRLHLMYPKGRPGPTIPSDPIPTDDAP